MASVQYGSIITEIKGKLQGQVFQGGNVGNILRNKGYISGNGVNRRNIQNNKLAAITAAWKTLTDAERLTWDALKPSWIFYNKFGASYQGNGFQIYTACNLNLVTIGEPPTNTAPSPVAIADPIFTNLVATESGQTIDFDITIPYAGVYLAFGQAAGSAGRNSNYPKLVKLQYGNAAFGGTINLGGTYSDAFTQFKAGQRITVVVSALNNVYPYQFFKTTLTTIAV